MPRISQDGIDLIKRFEGYRPTVYLDIVGKQTVGYGHLLRPGESFGYLDRQAAEALLRHDVAFAEAAVNRLITVPLHPFQFDALTSFVFNLGSGCLQRSTLRRVVNREEHAQAADEFHKYRLAGGRISKGLVLRRAAEADLYYRGYLETLPWLKDAP